MRADSDQDEQRSLWDEISMTVVNKTEVETNHISHDSARTPNVDLLSKHDMPDRDL